MNEDLITEMEKNLNDYRRAMFKTGKNLGRKADITRRTAIALIEFIDNERQTTTKASKEANTEALRIADVRLSFAEIKQRLLDYKCKDIYRQTAIVMLRSIFEANET